MAKAYSMKKMKQRGAGKKGKRGGGKVKSSRGLTGRRYARK